MAETPDWRARRWAATHQRIYDTALELFERHGFDAVNVGQVAREADISAPTFYAHYPSKEHLLMQLPTAEDIAALLSTQPEELSVGERIRRAVPLFFAQWDGPAELRRWRVIATTPALRTRAAEFERATAGLVADAMPVKPGSAAHSDAIRINAYLSAYTAGLLAWADGNGERKPEELIDEAFDALEGR